MTRDEVIALAKEAGIPVEIDWAGRPSTLVVKNGSTYLRGVEDLERFAALVAAHEREACAEECEAFDDFVGHQCAAAIRARGRE